VRSLKTNLSMLAVSPGYINTGTTNGVRVFYEAWARINGECISAGYEKNSGGNLSFVAQQLRRLLENFPADKTTIGVLEVFPACIHSPILFGYYMTDLEDISASTPVTA
jgi:hypothetical protein